MLTSPLFYCHLDPSSPRVEQNVVLRPIPTILLAAKMVSRQETVEKYLISFFPSLQNEWGKLSKGRRNWAST